MIQYVMNPNTNDGIYWVYYIKIVMDRGRCQFGQYTVLYYMDE